MLLMGWLNKGELVMYLLAFQSKKDKELIGVSGAFPTIESIAKHLISLQSFRILNILN